MISAGVGWVMIVGGWKERNPHPTPTVDVLFPKTAERKASALVESKKRTESLIALHL